MSTNLYSINFDKYAYEAIEIMHQNNISSLLVTDGEEYVGILTKMDWMHQFLKGDCDSRNIKVLSLMSRIGITIDVDKPVVEASLLMEKKRIRHLPVTRKRKIVGMFSEKDLERYYSQLHKLIEF